MAHTKDGNEMTHQHTLPLNRVETMIHLLTDNDHLGPEGSGGPTVVSMPLHVQAELHERLHGGSADSPSCDPKTAIASLVTNVISSMRTALAHAEGRATCNPSSFSSSQMINEILSAGTDNLKNWLTVLDELRANRRQGANVVSTSTVSEDAAEPREG